MRRSPDSVLSRSIAAIVGGYAVSNLVAIAFATALPMVQAEAVMTSMMLSFLFYALAAIWAFSAKTAMLGWAGMIVTGLIALLIWGAYSLAESLV